MKAVRIPLKPHTHFHFGEFKVDSNIALSTTSDIAHSDTFFSALVNVYNEGVGNANEFVKFFLDGKINLSSLFYYLKKGETIVYLLPKPVVVDIISPRDGKHKLRNQIKFVSKGIWTQGIIPGVWLNNTNHFCFIQKHDILLTKDEFKALGLTEKDTVYSVVDIPKSPIRKNDSKDSIYYQTDIEIGEIKDVEIGCYFMYSANEEVEIELKRAISLLVYSGLGGEKNTTGRSMGEPNYLEDFKIEPIEDLKMTKGFTNLSLLNPANYNELADVTYSQTLLRGGRNSGNGEYKVVRMIAEGALLSTDEIKGRLVEIGTDLDGNTVLRNGLAFVIPLSYYKTNE